MKEVMLSIQPKWCSLIANGKKTVEIRKTKPATETPFKCYIYCTKSNEKLWILNKKIFPRLKGDIAQILNAKDVGGASKANDKVIGEFVCYDISTYCTEFYSEERQPIFEAVYQLNEEQSDEQEEIWEAVLSNDVEYKTRFEGETCLSLEDVRNYLGIGENRFFGWRISDLVIYDEPKKLSEFKKYNRKCYFSDLGLAIPKCSECKECQLTRHPQSWCYVEGWSVNEMTNIELKFCPFCGGEAEIVWDIGTSYNSFPEENYHVSCIKCGCDIGGVFGFETEEEAAEAWNKRAK